MAEMPGYTAPFAAGNTTTKRNGARDGGAAKLECSPLHLLFRAGQCAGDIFQREIGWRALTPRQYAILLTVSQNEGLSQMHLVEKTGIDRSTLAEVVHRMEQTKGLLHRRRTMEDSRAYAVKLTKKGWRVLEAANPLARLVDEKMLAALPGRQREQFMQDLRTLIVALTNDAP